MSSQPVQQSDDSILANRSRVSAILQRLDRERPVSDWMPNHAPVDTLVETILSQSTSDVNTGRAFAALRRSFSDWSHVATADVDEVIEAIRPGGLAAQKGPRIQKVLAEILPDSDADPNEVLQERLAAMTTPDAMRWLTSFPGVGPKTAACVLLFAVGKPVVPVDTHVYRVSGRIGLIGPDINADRAHQALLELVPPGDSYRFHVHLIRHGRAVCTARSPQCNRCTLNDLCDYAMLNDKSNSQERR